MKQYHIRTNTKADRYAIGGLPGTGYQPFTTTKAVIYTEKDTYARNAERHVFNLPDEAKPYTRVSFRIKDIITKEIK